VNAALDCLAVLVQVLNIRGLQQQQQQQQQYKVVQAVLATAAMSHTGQFETPLMHQPCQQLNPLLNAAAEGLLHMRPSTAVLIV
jgi:hypothetical protein